jgi:hypothetical protein
LTPLPVEVPVVAGSPVLVLLVPSESLPLPVVGAGPVPLLVPLPVPLPLDDDGSVVCAVIPLALAVAPSPPSSPQPASANARVQSDTRGAAARRSIARRYPRAGPPTSAARAKMTLAAPARPAKIAGMRRPSWTLAACLPLTAALLAACFAPAGQTTVGTGGASTTTGTGSGTTGAPTTGGPSTGPGTGSGTDTGSTGAETTAGTSSSTGSTGSTDPGTSTGATTGSTGSGTTDAPPGPACAVDADCKLHDDCCVCAGVPVDEDIASCEETCKQPKCSEYGVDSAICRFGVCTTERLSCDQTQVACDAPTPPCPDGQLPETNGLCWTGACVPAPLCDAVPDCAYCPVGTMCVQNIGRGPQGWPRCEPIPAACGRQVDCDCVGDLVCSDMFSLCAINAGVVECQCVNC